MSKKTYDQTGKQSRKKEFENYLKKNPLNISKESKMSYDDDDDGDDSTPFFRRPNAIIIFDGSKNKRLIVPKKEDLQNRTLPTEFTRFLKKRCIKKKKKIIQTVGDVIGKDFEDFEDSVTVGTLVPFPFPQEEKERKGEELEEEKEKFSIIQTCKNVIGGGEGTITIGNQISGIEDLPKHGKIVQTCKNVIGGDGGVTIGNSF